jgi:hypothetical protein
MSPEAKRPEWYQRDVQGINADAQRLLENYSGLAPEEVLPHILSLVCLLGLRYHYSCIDFFLSATKHLMSIIMPASVR